MFNRSFLVRVIAVAYGTFLTVLLLTPHPFAILGFRSSVVRTPDRGVHLIAFLVLGLLVFASRWPRGRTGALRRRAALVVLLIYGSLMEGLQWFVPLRQVELLDLLENWLGILIALTVVEALLPAAPRVELTRTAPQDELSGSSPGSTGDSS